MGLVDFKQASLFMKLNSFYCTYVKLIIRIVFFWYFQWPTTQKFAVSWTIAMVIVARIKRRLTFH